MVNVLCNCPNFAAPSGQSSLGISEPWLKPELCSYGRFGPQNRRECSGCPHGPKGQGNSAQTLAWANT